MFGKLFSKLERREEPLIHPDFRIRKEIGDGFVWWWNYTNFGDYIHKKKLKLYRERNMIKVAFAFDDPKMLDDCSFMCKIGLNDNKDTKYFGIAYAYGDDIERIKSWAQQFPRAELISFLGQNAVTTPNSKKERIAGS